MADFIELFISYIKCYTLADIQRELNCVTHLQFDSITAVDQEIINKKILLEETRKFLIAHPALPVDWSNHCSCYKELAQWYDSQTTENFITKRYAVLAWKVFFEKSIPTFLYPGDILLLGKTFFDQPNAFAAFILFALEKEVTPIEMVNSGLLHQYFQINVIDLLQIQQVYELLKTFSLANALINYLTTTHVMMRAFCNFKSDDGRYRSYNVMGLYFSHHNEIPFSDKKTNSEFQRDKSNPWNEHIFVNENVIYAGDALYQVFGWELINVLDFSNVMSRIVFFNLIKYNSHNIIELFPIQALSGELNQKIISELLTQIARYPAFLTIESIEELIEKHFFYVNLLPYQNNQLTLFSHELVVSKIKALQNISNSVSVIFLLCQLVETLEKIDSYNEFSMLLKRHLFDWLIEHDNLMSDEISERISNLSNMNLLCKEKLLVYHNSIHQLIEQFNNDQIDFDTVKMGWVCNLKHIHVFLEIDESLKQKIRYPYTIYELETMILEKQYEIAEKNKVSFSILTSVNKLEIYEEKDVKRLLLESLLYIQELNLIQEIIQFLREKHLGYSFLEESFGTEENLIEKAINQQNDLLLNCLAPYLSESKGKLIHYLECAWLSKNLSAMKIISQHKKINQYVLHRVILNCYVNATNDPDDPHAFDQFDCEALQFFCNPKNKVKPSRSIDLQIMKKAKTIEHHAVIEWMRSIVSKPRDLKRMRSPRFFDDDISEEKAILLGDKKEMSFSSF